jgi:hypothetical protein
MKVFELREQDRKEWFLRLNREMAEHDRNSYVESPAQKIFREGILKGIHFVAKNMKIYDVDISEICLYTGLTEEEINKL